MKKRIRRQAVERYRVYLTEQEKSNATIEKYIRDVYKLYDFLGKKEHLDKQTLLRFKEELITRYTAVSVNSMLAAVNGFFSFMGWPELRMKRLKTQRSLFRSPDRELDKKEYLRLLEAAKNTGRERLYLIMLTLGGTGIRISELPFITVNAVLRGQAEVSCKNKVRVIFIPGKLRQQLIRYIKKTGRSSGPVFVTARALPVDRNNVWKEMKQLAADAQVAPQKVFPHNLRHLFASTYYRQEKDIVKLADILGHSNIETTRIYTIATGREHARQISRMGLVQ